MNTIDQRILLPTSPSIVWNYISDIANNPDWQVDCRSINFLTSQRQGPGTRWRVTTESGRDFVVEITAWYDRLGYEYRIVDGASFKQNRGRIRLQEVVEGTVIQWTFNYDFGGVLGGVRNAMGTRRTIENTMVDSLWTLWRHISQSDADKRSFEAKSLMRDGPDVEARAHYKPRHRSVMEEHQMQADAQSQPDLTTAPLIAEPPVAEDDTRPRPAVAVVTEGTQQPALSEPDFLADLKDDMPETGLSMETLPATAADEVQPPAVDRPTDSVILIDRVAIDEPEVPAELTEQTAALVEPLPVTETAADLEFAEIDPMSDTSSLSVFELFGVPKPSESQEIQAVQAEAGSVSLIASSSAAVSDGRQGRRAIARRNQIHLRRRI